MNATFRTIGAVISACAEPTDTGRVRPGTVSISEKSGDKITPNAVYKWMANGIPERHWALVMGMCPVTVEELHRLNEQARAAVVMEGQDAQLIER